MIPGLSDHLTAAEATTITARYARLCSKGPVDERTRRLWAAAEARAAGRGGIAAVAKATGISESTIRRGLRELDHDERLPPGRVRRPGAGRPPIAKREPGLEEDLDRLIDPADHGSKPSPLRWTSKSGAKLAAGLQERGHRVVERTVLRLLTAKGYSLQANRQTRDGARHPDREAQFEYISRTVIAAIGSSQPVIAVEVYKQGTQVAVSDETGPLTAGALLAWWDQLGRHRHPDAVALTITADCAGLSAEQGRGWGAGLQTVGDRSGLELVVCHFPAGTTRWEGVGHRLICRERPGPRAPADHEVVISLIRWPAPTETTTSFTWLDLDEYRAADTPPSTGGWNYRIQPSIIKS